MLDPSPFASHLDPGEQLLWSGQPKQGVRLQAQDAFLIPFSLMWGGFAIFWEAGVLGLTPLTSPHRSGGGPPLFMAVWGIPFVLVGLYMIFGRFFYDAASRSKTYYGLTNRRIIILKRFIRFDLNSFDLSGTSNLNLSERGDGSGDILFGTPGPMQSMVGSGWPTGGRGNRVPGFYLLPNAREVFNTICAAQAAARRTESR